MRAKFKTQIIMQYSHSDYILKIPWFYQNNLYDFSSQPTARNKIKQLKINKEYKRKFKIYKSCFSFALLHWRKSFLTIPEVFFYKSNPLRPYVISWTILKEVKLYITTKFFNISFEILWHRFFRKFIPAIKLLVLSVWFSEQDGISQ